MAGTRILLAELINSIEIVYKRSNKDKPPFAHTTDPDAVAERSPVADVPDGVSSRYLLMCKPSAHSQKIGVSERLPGVTQ